MRKKSLLSATVMFCLAFGAVTSIGCKKDDPPKTEDKKASAESKDKTQDKKADDKKADDKDDKKADDDKAKPKGKKKGVDKLPADQKTVAMPTDWTRLYDSVRLYEFYAPDGSQLKTENSDGVDFVHVVPPAPAAFEVFVFAWKDPNVSQEDLIAKAQEFQKNGGATDVKVSNVEKVNDYSQIADYETTEKDGTHHKGDVLVFTDVSDNYMLFVESAADKYEANKDVMDAVWQSFGIYGRDDSPATE